MPGSDETRELTAVFNGGLTLRRSSDLPHGMAPQKSLFFFRFGILSTPAIWDCSPARWMGAGFSFGVRCGADGVPYPAARCAHTRGRDAAEHAIRWRVRCLLHPH